MVNGEGPTTWFMTRLCKGVFSLGWTSLWNVFETSQLHSLAWFVGNNPKVLNCADHEKRTTFHYHVGLPGNRYNFAIFQSYELYGTRSLPRTFSASAALLMAVDLWQTYTESMKRWRQRYPTEINMSKLAGLLCACLRLRMKYMYIYISLCMHPLAKLYLYYYIIILSDHMQSPSLNSKQLGS